MPKNIIKKETDLFAIIKKVTHKKVAFLDLENIDKNQVLRYIEQNNLDIKVFGEKWFDILSNKFYAIEFLPKSTIFLGVEKNTVVFDNFGSFYNYVRGDIYTNSCFYGYVFSQEEIKQFSIDINKLNCDSFTHETIDNYSFDQLLFEDRIATRVSENRKQRMIEWIEKCPPITNLTDLENNSELFKREFDIFDSRRIFFSLIARRDKDISKKAFIDYACKHDGYEGVSFYTILLKYGKEAAEYVIENHTGTFSYNTYRKRIRNFKNALECYESGNYILERHSGFDTDSQLYYLFDRYTNNKNLPLQKVEFFVSFEEFISFVENDLSGANLSKAPISSEVISKYKTDSKTKFPVIKNCNHYELMKRFLNDEYVVEQKWLNNESLIFHDKHNFVHFFDFVHFLKKDLSNADLIMCDGVENIIKLTDLKIDGIKVRSDDGEKLGVPLNNLLNTDDKPKEFSISSKNEVETTESFLLNRSDDDYSSSVSYISDIHLLHRFESFKCLTYEDRQYVIRSIVKTISEESTNINLIGGDTSSDFDVFTTFIKELALLNKSRHFFFVLGNHEFWGLCNQTYPNILLSYQKMFEQEGNGYIHLVHNNLFYMDIEKEWHEINENELLKITPENLRNKMRGSKLIIFGGTGFAGANVSFNADNGIYMTVLSRAQEQIESKKFLSLYEKVTNALHGKNVIILTHMPLKDWAGPDAHTKKGFVYVNGHNHKNYFFDDGNKRIYADNQIGYNGKRLSLKTLSINMDYDWFSDFRDGIYSITKDDYQNFYHGIGEFVTLNREFENIYMVKREDVYLFLAQNKRKEYLVMDGGSIRKVGKHDLNYFYNNLLFYSKSVKMFLSKYNSLQSTISNEVKKFGGDGWIHGCIIDINFLNHLYVNPLDGSITPYFAYSMVKKYVYNNVPSLLKENCPKMFEIYMKQIQQAKLNNEVVPYFSTNLISSKRTFISSTEMYKISRIIKGLQFTTKYNVVRIWNDSLANNASEENGKIIVSNLIAPFSSEQNDKDVYKEYIELKKD